ncbi:hypothetical protein FQN55_004848 [Onygenales sp. PD_40]|nr:hypothetical protein FQN55_004848 [Onygenales sp. PD_40]
MNLHHICAIVDAPRGALTVPSSRLQQFPFRWKDYGPGEDRWYPEPALDNAIKELIDDYEEIQKESLAHSTEVGRRRPREEIQREY